jgi:predicted ATPase
MEQTYYWAVGIVVSILGFFLKNIIADHEKTKDLANQTKAKLDLVENDYLNKHSHLSEKMEDLYGALKELSIEIKELTKELKSK